LIPRFGVRAERRREASIFSASVAYEFSLPGATSVDQQELLELGRVRPDDAWDVVRWNLGYSFYLEPLFAGGYTRGKTSLAHELALSFRGQYAMNDRLIPTEEQVAGGLYSVRGYRESATAADTVLLATAEYRFHLPRAFEPTENDTTLFGERFRYAPASPGGRPDWDLIGRAFVDWGRTVNSKIEDQFEKDEDLLSTGLGLEFVYRQNLSVRVDWGMALSDLESPKIDSGSSRIHFVATILY
ncbi:MAG: hypothetical protein KDA28_08060, partial [Phycisphaerales bacterium]|nr:hypothetical protein [Phycisphaerales bacterium]